MDMKISDTMSGKLHEVGGKEISIYLCGVTVYDKSHIGHARTIVVFDVLSRHLELNGINVKLVQNFTDVDDKIIARAKKDGSTAKDVSEKYMKDYYECFDALNVKRAFAYPLATAHIEDMVEFISKLIKSDAAYATENGVYFAVEKFSEYGKLSKKDVNDLPSLMQTTSSYFSSVHPLCSGQFHIGYQTFFLYLHRLLPLLEIVIDQRRVMN